jgi:hypothetical protein
MVENTYRRAPFFGEVFPIIENLIRHDADNLSDYLEHQLRTLSEFMGIQTEFVTTSRYYGNAQLSGQDRVLDICRREGATVCINPQGSIALYGKGDFAQCGVELKLLIPSAVEYKQFGSKHVPWLSIIDVLMFNSREQLSRLLNRYELI